MSSRTPRNKADKNSNALFATRQGLQSDPSLGLQPGSIEGGEYASSPSMSKKKRQSRAHRRHQNRRRSSAGRAHEEANDTQQSTTPRDNEAPHDDVDEGRATNFYNIPQGNLSGASIDSEELLDHRDQPSMRTRPRQSSLLSQSLRPDSLMHTATDSDLRSRHRAATVTLPRPSMRARSPPQYDGDSDEPTDRTPLIPRSYMKHNSPRDNAYKTGSPPSKLGVSPKTNRNTKNLKKGYDVNYPPSVPGSPPPRHDPARSFTSPVSRSSSQDFARRPFESVIDVDASRDVAQASSRPASPAQPMADDGAQRHHTVSLPVEEDVCFPSGGLLDLGDEEEPTPAETSPERSRRRRRRVWPDLSVLEEWSQEEKARHSDVSQAKRINEPMLIGGRLRPSNGTWRRLEESAPYRFTYFNEELQSTIHSQTISDLLQPGQTFRDLFIPEPPELDSTSEDDSDDEEDVGDRPTDAKSQTSPEKTSNQTLGENNSPKSNSEKPKRYGPRPTFWLDVLSPTDAEMKVLAKTFGVHALTVEDIMVQEAREKVELFRHYYFLNYRTFDQNPASESYLQPVNMYVIVFREGLLSFHFSIVPHPANVRRRIRQLKDYLILSSDWISYALIDDITDVFGPLIRVIENEVDAIDDIVLRLYSESAEDQKQGEKYNYMPCPPVSGSDMLRRVGECRKKVMGLYRLLGNKADVIKGFAKRCNEHWDVAPRSEIGLYLGDIQDHIVTMTGNLSHYETLLSRAHSNYLAQININMNERQEMTADVLGKLTVLGTIVMPLNIITGMWGMNVKVPGQDVDSLTWFFSITTGLLVFGVISFYIAKRVYGIV